jgi:hypothetical protein
VAGHLPRDAVEEGDLLRGTRDGVVRHEACTGVAPVHVRDPAASPMIGLLVSNVEPSEFPEGLVTEVLSTRVDRGAPGGIPCPSNPPHRRARRV